MSEADARTMMMYDIKKKSMVLAYLLWWFLGTFGAHRFYLGRTGSAIAMLCLTLVSTVLVLVFIGFFGLAAVGVWWLVDAFLIYSMVNEHNLRLAEQLA
ncbi:MAG TPA: TM2 domain-containing protein [Phycisphaerales bacterium]|nr:TM2 domain-containing protein [Phycisphaerales bacterium]